MIILLTAVMLFAPTTLDQVRAEPNLEHRSKAAMEYAYAAERDAEAAYAAGDMARVKLGLRSMQDGVELADETLRATGKSARHHPGPFKTAEIISQTILRRLSDLDRRMDSDERPVLDAPRTRVQEIHDSWFDSIMSRAK